LRAQNAELEAKLLELAGQPEPLEKAKPTRTKVRQPTPGNGESHGDDLKQIRGIGPKFERALHARGIRSFSQIAAWTASELEELARALRVKPERIRKEDWVGRARALLASPEKE
jgi:NADH-quinone oxidoreductase subunit E